MSLRNAASLLVVVCAALGSAAGAIGCLSDDTSVSPIPRDAGAFDAGVISPVFDAGNVVDGATTPTDAGVTVEDAAVPTDGSSPRDAGRDATSPSQAGLVAGGSVGHSPSYRMTGTTGPATAPVLRSPNYRLVGGVSATGEKP